MPPGKRPELVIPVEDDDFWNNLFSQRQAVSNLGIPPQKPDELVPISKENDAYIVADGDDEGANPEVASTETGGHAPGDQPKQLTAEELSDPQKQHEIIDSFRSTDGIDYEQLRQEATQLVALRRELERAGRKALFRKIGKEKYPNFAGRFPKFFDSIRLCETHRLNEFLNVMHMMLTKLSQVKNNVITHTEMRNEVFEKDLAHRYYKRKDA